MFIFFKILSQKTISDLSKKLEEQECIVKGMDEKLKASTESNVALIERIKQLEEQITSYGVSNKAADVSMYFI